MWLEDEFQHSLEDDDDRTPEESPVRGPGLVLDVEELACRSVEALNLHRLLPSKERTEVAGEEKIEERSKKRRQRGLAAAK